MYSSSRVNHSEESGPWLMLRADMQMFSWWPPVQHPGVLKYIWGMLHPGTSVSRYDIRSKSPWKSRKVPYTFFFISRLSIWSEGSKLTPKNTCPFPS